MAKRFTDSEIWKKQRWFKKLNPIDKLVFFYLKDECDHAGFYKIDIISLIEDIGLEDKFDINEFINRINKDYDPISGEQIVKERLKIVSNNYIWITGFIKFQYQNKEGLINQKIPAVKSALAILKKHNVFDESLNKGYITLVNSLSPLKEGLQTVKDKDRDKDIDMDKDMDKDIDKDKDKEYITKRYRDEIKILNKFTY